MKIKKISLCIMLSLALIITLIPVTSFADDEQEPAVQAASDEYCDHMFYESYRDDATCTSGGTIYYYCSKCGAEKTESIPPTAHQWSGWYISEEPDCTCEGTEYRECLNCYEYEQRSVPALGHSWSDPDIVENNDYYNVLMYGVSCTNEGCEETKRVTFKTIKKGKSKNLLTKKQLRAMKKTFKNVRFYSSNKKILKINKKTGKMKAKKRGTTLANLKGKYRGQWIYIEFRIVVK